MVTSQAAGANVRGEIARGARAGVLEGVRSSAQHLGRDGCLRRDE